ncbi:MAG: hypothetical protein E6J91_22815 [Deltaproteobacteria bacterium]|nr:MAG: hypothetical protein E6J91_22815 [Deltaproteobacteria bacterium]
MPRRLANAGAAQRSTQCTGCSFTRRRTLRAASTIAGRFADAGAAQVDAARRTAVRVIRGFAVQDCALFDAPRIRRRRSGRHDGNNRRTTSIARTPEVRRPRPPAVNFRLDPSGHGQLRHPNSENYLAGSVGSRCSEARMGLIDVGGSFDQLRFSRLRHQLAAHPSMATERLAELALRIAPEYVRFHDGERSVGTHMGSLLQIDPTRDSLRRAIDNLHKVKTFVQVVNVRSDAAYRAVVDEVLDEVSRFLPPRDRPLLHRDAAMFLASPSSVTPFHLDHEQNFLCHIRGPKTFYVWDHRDRSLVSDRAREVFYHEGKLREIVYRPDMQPKAQVIELMPGDCLYMPMGSPHAASTGNDITVTFSILMNTQSSFETVQAYQANSVIRRFGLSPRPIGDSAVRDSLKRRTLDAVRRMRDFARGRHVERRPQWY